MTDAAPTREHLLHLLVEAAELEHNLLCSYLYAALALKHGRDDDLTPAEAQAVAGWRRTLLDVCVEEMAHLAQVANLALAVGSRPHFDRPNLPVAPGYHPARLVVQLTPLDLQTLRHFIFLERPAEVPVPDGEGFEPEVWYERRPESGWLMPGAPDYATIGEFYEHLRSTLDELVTSLGEQRLFIGASECQLTPAEVGAPHVAVVKDAASARRALDFIVLQGEGSERGREGSHFERFQAMEQQYLALQAARPAFNPSRPVARNPVMRFALAADRVHVTAPAAAAVLDAANAAYSLMLRCLTQVYETPEPAARKALVEAALGLMRVMSALADALADLPATEPAGAYHAGMSFTMLRSNESLLPHVAGLLLRERLDALAQRLPELPLDAALLGRLQSEVQSWSKGLAACT